MTVSVEPIAPVELRNCISPAKLNLFLHVLGQRDDGYHELETAFELIDLHDVLHFGIRTDGAIMRRGGIHGLAHDNDLSVQAARLLAAASETRHGVDIEIIKEIPMGGGLGGGSSNAATTLLALNRLWGVNWPVARLARLALQLGADVPVFVHGTAALASGVGEKLTPLELPYQLYVIVAPAVIVPTAEIFGDPDLTRDTKPLKILPLSHQSGQPAESDSGEPESTDWLESSELTGHAGLAGQAGLAGLAGSASDNEASSDSLSTGGEGKPKSAGLQAKGMKGSTTSGKAASRSRRAGRSAGLSRADPMTGLSVEIMETIGRNDLEAVTFARYPAVEQALTELNKAAEQVKPEPLPKAAAGSRKKSGKGQKPAAASETTDAAQASEQALADQDDPDAAVEPRGVDWSRARMSGSGACVFLPVSTRKRAEEIAEKIRQFDLGTVYIARSLKAHPMRSWAFGRGLPRRSS